MAGETEQKNGGKRAWDTDRQLSEISDWRKNTKQVGNVGTQAKNGKFYLKSFNSTPLNQSTVGVVAIGKGSPIWIESLSFLMS